MAQVTVQLNSLRQAPRKVRLVIDVVRGRRLIEARAMLALTTKRAAGAVGKLLASAADAAQQRGLSTDTLWVSEVRCDQGTALKRRLINSRGRASGMKKFFSHVTLTVSDEVKKAKKTVKNPKSEIRNPKSPPQRDPASGGQTGNSQTSNQKP